MMTTELKVGDKLVFMWDSDEFRKGSVRTVCEIDSNDDEYPYKLDCGGWARADAVTLYEKVSAEEYPGYIVAKETTHNSDEATFEVVLVADEKGYASIKALVERSQVGGKRAELERKIAELQAELDAL